MCLPRSHLAPSVSLEGCVTNKRVCVLPWGASLRIQPPLIRSRYYVRNAKRQVVAGVNERWLYLRASRESERGKNLTLLILPCHHARIRGYLSFPFLHFPFTPPPPPHIGCSGTFSDNYLTYRVVSKTGQNRSRREHMLSKDVEAKLFTVIFARLK